MNRHQVEEFLFKEARLLDEVRLKEWLDLTASDFIYWIPVNEESPNPAEHLSIIYDSKTECSERIFRVGESGLNHPQDPPSRTVRFVSNVEVEPGPVEHEVTVYCNILLYEFRSGGARRDFHMPNSYAGRCQYLLRREGNDWKMAFKKVSFVNMDGIINAMSYFI